ncbi:acetyltransferase [Vibrio cholerae]
MVTVVVIEFSVMRCQPLRRALCAKKSEENYV